MDMSLNSLKLHCEMVMPIATSSFLLTFLHDKRRRRRTSPKKNQEEKTQNLLLLVQVPTSCSTTWVVWGGGAASRHILFCCPLLLPPFPSPRRLHFTPLSIHTVSNETIIAFCRWVAPPPQKEGIRRLSLSE